MAATEPIDIDTLEYIRSEHSEEMEVLQSIYDGDANFKIINGSTVQYKIGENEEPLSILVEINWTANYPESVPSINLECFYNQHLPTKAKHEALTAISTQAWKNAGDQQTYTLVEWMKENILQIIGQYVFDEECRLENRENDSPNQEKNEGGDGDQYSKKESKKEQMTKAQKRREWNRMDKDGKLARGHDWVDVVRHLSQTGGGGGAADNGCASTASTDSASQ